MSGVFLYYLPGCNSQSLTHDEVLGFPYVATALRDCLRTPAVFMQSIIRKGIEQGPDGGPGVVIAAKPTANRQTLQQPIGFIPEDQKWQKAGPSWIGFDKWQPPAPERLRRDSFVDGYQHSLGDHQTWTCPVIRRCFVEPMVPQAFGFDPDRDKFVRRVQPEFEAAWRASAVWCCRFGTKHWHMTPDEMLQAASLCLGLNYRLSPVEIGILNLLDTASLDKILESAIDIPWLEEAASEPEKKSLIESMVLELRSSLPGLED